MNIFEKVKIFCAAFFKRATKASKSRKIALNSRFGHMLESVEAGTESYYRAAEAIALCDEGVAAVSQRIVTLERLKNLDDEIAELECYSKMSDEDAYKLKDLLERFIALGKDKNELKYQITSFDNAILKMEGLEDEADAAIAEIADAEKKRRVFWNDVGHLQGEKEDLEYELENLMNSGDFVYKFTIGIVAVFALCVTSLVLLRVFRDINIFPPLVILTILVVVTVAILYAFRKRIAVDLKMNVKKRKKAVGMINRKNAVYAHYTNFLNYEYRKFKVKSSDALKKHLKDYRDYKHLAKRFDAIRDIMFQTEAEINRVMRENGISGVKVSLDAFAKTFNIEDKKFHYERLAQNRAAMEADLERFDVRSAEIWADLCLLKELDDTEQKIITEVTQKYTDYLSDVLGTGGEKAESAEEKGNVENDTDKRAV